MTLLLSIVIVILINHCNHDNIVSGHSCEADIERPPEDLTCGISISNLTKKYRGMNRSALSSLSLELYENQVGGNLTRISVDYRDLHSELSLEAS